MTTHIEELVNSLAEKHGWERVPSKTKKQLMENHTLVCKYCTTAANYKTMDLKNVQGELLAEGWSVGFRGKKLGAPSYPICPECTQMRNKNGKD